MTIHRSEGWLGFHTECDPHQPTGEVTHIMRALETDVVNAVWAAIEPLLPDIVDEHPLGCHRPRVPDRLCFWGLLILLGNLWTDPSPCAFSARKASPVTGSVGGGRVHR